MKVYLNEISGLWNAIDSMYMSKRNWTREREEEIKKVYDICFDRWGKRCDGIPSEWAANSMNDMIEKLLKWAPRHITMGRFLDFAFSVEGLHRGAQDDFDSHAKRLENRILRSSTRLATYGAEKSDWYNGRILTTDEVLEAEGVKMPEKYYHFGVPYVRAVNGYVREDLAKDKDTLRGLYMLSIPSNFIFRVNCTEFAHILKERDKNGGAHPELQEAVEQMLALIQHEIPQFTREWFYSVKN